MGQQPTDFAPTEPTNADPAFANTCPFCGDLGDFEDDVREPMTASERAFLAAGYLLSGILVCVGLGAVIGWVFA